MDGCPLGLGLVVEDKPTEFSCIVYSSPCRIHYSSITPVPYIVFTPLVFSYLSRCECYDYLFDIATQMKQCGLDPAQQPSDQP